MYSINEFNLQVAEKDVIHRVQMSYDAIFEFQYNLELYLKEAINTEILSYTERYDKVNIMFKDYWSLIKFIFHFQQYELLKGIVGISGVKK